MTILWFVIFTLELARVPEEAPLVAPPISEPQSPAQSLSPNLPSRTEEPERPAERQPPLELPPEPCKVPVHVPMSNSILESLPMTHISTTLAGGTYMLFHCKYYLFFFSMCQKYKHLTFFPYRSICSITYCPYTTAKGHRGFCANEQSFTLSFKYNGTFWQAHHCVTWHWWRWGTKTLWTGNSVNFYHEGVSAGLWSPTRNPQSWDQL